MLINSNKAFTYEHLLHTNILKAKIKLESLFERIGRAAKWRLNKVQEKDTWNITVWIMTCDEEDS